MKTMAFVKGLVWAMLFGATLSASGQDVDGWAARFAESLEIGQQMRFDDAVLRKKLKPGDVPEVRAQVWAAWRQANKRFAERKLPPAEPLSDKARGWLVLPDSLEPDARMDFFWGQKGADSTAGQLPVFLYLHGSGPRDAEWATGLKLAQMFDDAPSLYFIPRIPNEKEYYRWWQRSKQWAWKWLLRQVFLQKEVDPRRLYVFGISEGGYGSQRLASFYADYWAAAGPMAGGEPLKNAPVENCGNIGFSFLTGADDGGFYRNELTALTAAAFDSLQSANPGRYVHRIELIPGRGHGIDYRPTTPWLKSFVRNPWPREFVWEDFEMDGWQRDGFYNLLVDRRPCDSLRTRYEVAVSEDNVVDIQVRNVRYRTVRRDSVWGIELEFSKELLPASGGELTLFLDEHLVDLRKKVTVRINGKQVFRGRPSCSVGSMMRSLSAFYDPERIYPVELTLHY